MTTTGIRSGQPSKRRRRTCPPTLVRRARVGKERHDVRRNTAKCDVVAILVRQTLDTESPFDRRVKYLEDMGKMPKALGCLRFLHREAGWVYLEGSDMDGTSTMHAGDGWSLDAARLRNFCRTGLGRAPTDMQSWTVHRRSAASAYGARK